MLTAAAAAAAPVRHRQRQRINYPVLQIETTHLLGALELTGTMIQ